MSLFKYVDRLKRMDDLIRRKATGTPEDFAKRLGIRKTMLMEELQEIKALGAEIEYCRMTESYYYQNSFALKIGIDKKDQETVKGGKGFLNDFNQFGITELKSFKLMP